LENKFRKILSIDSGASNVRSVIFDESGKTIISNDSQEGANITIDCEDSTKRIISIISDTLSKSSLSYDDISHFSLGLAGISDDAAREMLFKRLEECKISNRTHLTSDVNPIFEMNCADNSAILVSVGTGAICLGRNIQNNIEKVGGLGLDHDAGSGFWMGKELMIKLSFNKNEDHNERDFNELLERTLDFLGFDELNLAIDTIMQSNDRYQKIASICDYLFDLANNGNEIAISIVQQGSQHIADMIIVLCDQISYINDELIIIANGGVMNNSFFRKSLSDALSFDFTNIKWLFPTISSAYYPGLLSAKMLGMKVDINNIIENSEK
jgi:N-acetylglucosamine kinase-like BadF-type ATPase